MPEFSLTAILSKTPNLIPGLMMADGFDVEAVFSEAEMAVTKASQMLSVGADIQQCVPELFKFFKAQGEIDAYAAREKANHIALDKNKSKHVKGSAEDQFLGMMRARKLKELETNIKDLLIYSGNSDIYTEMCAVRQEIFLDREHERIEEIKQQEKLRMEKLRRRQKKIQRIEDFFTMLVGGCIIGALLYAIWLMISMVISLNLSH